MSRSIGDLSIIHSYVAFHSLLLLLLLHIVSHYYLYSINEAVCVDVLN